MDTKDAINQQQIDEWKAEFGRIFRTRIGEDVVIWRKLRRREYVEIMSDEEAEKAKGNARFARQELMTKVVTLYPDNIEELIVENAGLATCISDEVILKSGFDINPTEEL